MRSSKTRLAAATIHALWVLGVGALHMLIVHRLTAVVLRVRWAAIRFGWRYRMPFDWARTLGDLLGLPILGLQCVWLLLVWPLVRPGGKDNALLWPGFAQTSIPEHPWTGPVYERLTRGDRRAGGPRG